jgi:hypothetical protein
MEMNVSLPENSTESANIVNFGDSPGFVAYSVIMLVVVLIPVTVVDVVLLVALLLERTTPIQIRIVIVNLLLGALCVAFGAVLNHLTALVLSTTDHPVPPFDFCHFIVWVIAGSGAVRMIFTAVFSVIVFILVKSSAKAVNEKILAVCCAVLWIAAFVLSAPLLSPFVVGSQFLGNAACFPKNTELAIRALTFAYVPLWAIVFGVIPLVLTITIPIITACYLRLRSVSGNVTFKKAMVKLAFFLILVIVFNLIGQVIPPLLAIALASFSESSPFTYYLGLTLTNLSLIPTPILILAYLAGVRQKLKEMFLCHCVRFRDDMSKADHHSRKSMSEKRQDTMRSLY